MEGITGSVLSETLKLLEKHRLINKRVLIDYIPAKTEYHLTKKGKELRVIYGFIKNWALKWINEEQQEDLETNICCTLEIMPKIKQKIESIDI